MTIRLFLLGLSITILILVIMGGLVWVFMCPYKYYLIASSIVLGLLTTYAFMKWISTAADDNDRFYR